MSFEPIEQIIVSLDFGQGDPISVGRLALRAGRVYFEYDGEFIRSELDISPLRCPLRPGVQTFDPHLFEGLPGVFNDSLPDGWGRLLFDRKARLEGLMPAQFSPLDRLAHVGHSGMGALVYKPDFGRENAPDTLDLNQLAADAKQVLDGEATDVLQELLQLNGSSAGARPKAMIGVDASKQTIIHGTQAMSEAFEPWLVKFPNVSDGQDAGAIEYVYALMAVKAGLEMEPVHLFPGVSSAGYFATRRFDRNGRARLHTHSVCGLLHSDFRTPSLDYEDLIALTMILTKDIREAEKMYRLAVFNVLAYNRDDHSKNFSFIMDEAGEWRLSPVYDLTFSSGPGGEQSTMVMGEGRNPRVEHLVKLGQEAKLPTAIIEDAIEKTKTALAAWAGLAKEHGVMRVNIDLVASKIQG